MRYDFKKQLKSFHYAFSGITHCIGREQNLSFHLLATVGVVVAGCFFHISQYEWIAVIGCVGLVIAAELFNSAIERLVDLVSPQYHVIAGQVKDIAAGAVLICALTSAVIGMCIFIPYITTSL